MRPYPLVLALALVTACAERAPAVESAAATAVPEGSGPSALAPTVDVPFEEFTLANGLRVIVHEDHKAPVVAVSVWYGVGSRDEPPGRTGFAHLFEHLMFNGSENYNHEYFAPFEEVGATDMNGTTWFDRTNYFQNVPTPALELALWMESDRMGHLVGAIDQAKLDEQRGVVQNEKRQGDNQPYGKLEYHILAGLFPEGHPYRHSTIGSMEDLDAASLADVKTWFQTYYGAANTVLVVAGDTNVAGAKPLVEKYFGDIAAGPPLTKIDQWVPVHTENVTETMYDRVPQVRIQRVWAIPGRVTKDRTILDLAASVLGGGKASRLFRDLVYDKQLATEASASIEPHQLASQLSISVTVAPGKDPQEVVAEVDRIVADFLEKGPTAEELGRARTTIGSAFVRGVEQIGGFEGKATVLAEGALYAGDTSFMFDERFDWMNAATPAEVGATAKNWLSNGYYQITVEPFPELETVASTADRSKLPVVSTMPELTFPEVKEAKLDNGTRVVLAERHAVPVVEMALQFDAGYASDPHDRLGLASFASAMLDEGTKNRTAMALAEELESLGADLGAGSDLDTTVVTLSAMSANLKPSVGVFADVVQNPTFDDAEIERLRTRWLANIAQEKANPTSLALRLMPPELFGTSHPYGVPLTGSGDEPSIQALQRADLQKFQTTWLRPDNATLFVVGDTTMDAILPVLNEAFASWKAPADPLPKKELVNVALPAKPRIILIDKPGAEQSLILAGQVAPPTAMPDNLAVVAMNDVLGGQFTARINMNLRENKHWAYGAYTFLQDAAGQRPYIAYAPVQTDKTAESMAELNREFREFVGKKPATDVELDRVVKNSVRALPGQYETASAVLGSLQTSALYSRPWNYPATLGAAYGALTVDKIRGEAKAVLHPEQLVWVVVGDLSKIEAPVRALKLGDVEVRKLQ